VHSIPGTAISSPPMEQQRKVAFRDRSRPAAKKHLKKNIIDDCAAHSILEIEQHPEHTQGYSILQ